MIGAFALPSGRHTDVDVPDPPDVPPVDVKDIPEPPQDLMKNEK